MDDQEWEPANGKHTIGKRLGTGKARLGYKQMADEAKNNQEIIIMYYL